jgi:hypothetical protein
LPAAARLLLRRWPFDSLLALAFADLFFDEAEHDDPTKLPLAQQAYQKVLAYPPPANLAYAFAWYRLGVIASRMATTRARSTRSARRSPR